MTTFLHERLSLLVSALPSPRSSVTLSRDDLEALLHLDDPACNGARPERDLSAEEVAEMVGRAPSTVRGWVRSGALRGYKLNGRDWRVTRAALENYLEIQRAGRSTEQEAEVDISDWRRLVKF